MRRIYFLLILFLILAFFLSGCGMVTPSISDKAQIQNLISNFCVAASDGNWNLVQNYYYPNSTAYQMLEQFENLYNSYPQ